MTFFKYKFYDFTKNVLYTVETPTAVWALFSARISSCNLRKTIIKNLTLINSNLDNVQKQTNKLINFRLLTKHTHNQKHTELVLDIRK